MESPDRAPRETRAPTLWAVIIGIDEYADTGIPKLSAAVRDAKRFAHFIGIQERYGLYRGVKMQVLTDSAATQEAIRSALDSLADVREDDLVYCFFAGHGLQDSRKRTYLAAVDTRRNALFGTGIAMSMVEEALSSIASTRVILFIDACHSGAVGWNLRAAPEDLFSGMTARAVFSASRAQETSREDPELGHGLFTDALVSGLKGGADRDDDGVVNLGELDEYVRADVERRTRPGAGLPAEQHPVLMGTFDPAMPVAVLNAAVFERPRGRSAAVREEIPQKPSAPPERKPSPSLLPDGFTPIGKDRDPASGLPRRIRHDPSGYEMTLVPGGEFVMGSEEGVGDRDEAPTHHVDLGPYWIGVTEVTNEQFSAFMPEHSSGSFNGQKLIAPRQPVSQVTWDEASGWCAWAGLRLPTEAEWEKAARGTDQRPFPWGSEIEVRTSNSYEAPELKKINPPVGSNAQDVSPYGCRDMAGSVWEWCSDWYGEKYYSTSIGENPRGPERGSMRVLRGGLWYRNLRYRRSSNRYKEAPGERKFYIGFRAALSPRGK